MVQIVGKYKYASRAPNFESYLRSVGVPEATIPSVISKKPTLTISENNGQWTFHNSDNGSEWSSTFKLGEPFDEKTFSSTPLKSVVRREGDKFVIESTVHNSKDTRVYEFSDSGITVHMSNPKATESTSATYTRV